MAFSSAITPEWTHDINKSIARIGRKATWSPRRDAEPELHAVRDAVREVLHPLGRLAGEALVHHALERRQPAREVLGPGEPS